MQSQKSPQMQQFLDDMAEALFKRSRSKSVEAGICVSCSKKAEQFKDALSRVEYGISGMCQECQDSVFK